MIQVWVETQKPKMQELTWAFEKYQFSLKNGK
jgi:hypothetical protein